MGRRRKNPGYRIAKHFSASSLPGIHELATSTTVLGAFCNSIAWLALIGAAMGALEWLRPANPAQRFLRSGFVTDLIYWLTPYFLYGPLAPKTLAVGAAFVASTMTGSAAIGFSAIGRQPLWTQAAEAFALADFLSNWGHRWMHGRTLWAFHAIHHGSRELDWLSTIRNHPVNVVVQRIVLTAPLLLLGFPVHAILVVAPFSALYNIFCHANVDLGFGPLRHLFVSPILPRWRHTSEGQGCHSNYGEALAIWDVMFGTFYLPQGLPGWLGLDNGPPPDFVGQTLWPIHYFLAPADSLPAMAD